MVFHDFFGSPIKEGFINLWASANKFVCANYSTGKNYFTGMPIDYKLDSSTTTIDIVLILHIDHLVGTWYLYS